MNWAAIAAVCAVLTLLVTILGIAYMSGKLTQKISDLEKCKDDHDGRLDNHEARISANALNIGRLQEWKEGFQAAAHTVRRSEGK